MNILRFRRTALAVATAAVLPFALAACSDSDSGKDAAAGSTAEASADASSPRRTPRRR